MDELRGPTIQIVLHVKEGLGFGFLKTPFIVSGSLNGYMLETDSTVPSHAPAFDAELVWEADKRRFRSLRVQNVPIKVEVFTLGTQGRKDKVGYLLLSLLGAQPCPSNKIFEVKHTWHRLLGVKNEGKCCHPQLMLSLTVQDRVSTITPRNELRMFHSNESAYPPTYAGSTQPTGRSILMTLQEYIAESKKTASTPELRPQLMVDEGLIQIGEGKHQFVLSLLIGSVENLDLLLPDHIKEPTDCFVTYSIFTHNVMTDRMSVSETAAGSRCVFNQRTMLRVRGSLRALAGHFAECPHLVTKMAAAQGDIGICSMDLRKLIPTEDVDQFLTFCNDDKALVIHERCFLLRFDEREARADGRRAFVDIQMALKYVGVMQENTQKPPLTARSVSQLDRASQAVELECRAGSCTQLADAPAQPAYTNMAATNTSRYKNADGESVIQSTDLAEMIKKMCESLTESQERLLARVRPATSDMQVQCETDSELKCGEPKCNEPKLETSKSDTCIIDKNYEAKHADIVQLALSSVDRATVMQKYVDELEDWKERQQEMFKIQLKRKEQYHLELLANEWSAKRVELESRLSRGVEQCRALAADLSAATDDFRLRGYRNTEREKRLLDAKKALESHYTAKYQELREASQKMEDDMNHRLKMKDMRIEELETKVLQLEKQTEALKNNLINNEKEAESKYSGLTKDQTASLIQELRCLEEKLDAAVQSKAFFKEQWGRAVRELHLTKMATRRHVLDQLRRDRMDLATMGAEAIPESPNSTLDLQKLKDDFYVDLLAQAPAIDATSLVSASGPDCMEMYQDLKLAPKPHVNEKLTGLIAERDSLIKQDNPNEDALKQLNHEIRSMLINCGT